MGMYTGLRFRAKLKPQAIAIIRTLNLLRSWQELSRAYPVAEFIRWAEVGRANFIPFGALCYMPDQWDKQATEGTSRLVHDEWGVICSLKNYGGEIEQFLREVLPLLIVERCLCEALYEEADEPKIIEVEPKAFEMKEFSENVWGLVMYFPRGEDDIRVLVEGKIGEDTLMRVIDIDTGKGAELSVAEKEIAVQCLQDSYFEYEED